MSGIEGPIEPQEVNSDEEVEQTKDGEAVDESRRKFLVGTLRGGAGLAAGAAVGAMGLSPESAEAKEEMAIEQTGIELSQHQVQMLKINVGKKLPEAISTSVSRVKDDELQGLVTVRLSILTRDGEEFKVMGGGFSDDASFSAVIENLRSGQFE